MEAAPPAVPDDLVEEILLRLPPDDPACLLRASIVCKDWGDIVSRPAFRRRLHELHRRPLVLGLLHGSIDWRISCFIPTTASFCPATPCRRFWRGLDCRHGRALFVSRGQDNRELLMWEPTTGAQKRVPVPAAFKGHCLTVTVLCAADGCDHRHCLGGPFRVVFSFENEEGGNNLDANAVEKNEVVLWVRSASVYSSETGTWGELTSVHAEFNINYSRYSSVLVGSSLVYFMPYGQRMSILEYDLANHTLTVFDPPGDCYDRRYNLILMEDGGLGVIENLDTHLKLWTIEVIDDTDAQWVLNRVIYLDNLLPTACLLGFAEGANVILVCTVAGIFTIELQSEHVRKVCNYRGYDLIPVVSFYTPAPRGEHQETIDKAHQLFDEGPNAIGGRPFQLHKMLQL